MEAHKTLVEVYPTSAELEEDFEGRGLKALGFPDSFPWAVFYTLIKGRHANAEIISPDDKLDAWKDRFCSIVWQFGPSWVKQVDIQKTLREMSEADLMKGSLLVSSNALNPAQKPQQDFEGTDIPKVDTINQQATSQSRRSKMDAYASLSALLRTDVTEGFLRRFDSLFRNIYSNDCEAYCDGE